uniref:sn-glycerol-3-phosphate ABC transporter ATP-binding protein UgpC n=1 Tax=candidate division WOR-3 bacterium TaxID=2052148 RepID=A0A7C4XVC4_UNCW3
MAQLRLENVTKIYDKNIYAVKDISFTVYNQEFLILLGPSGCGKTTILRLIAGLESVTSGKIFIDETCVNEISPGKRNIAMVFQNYALYPHMTVYDNIAFGLKMQGLPSSEIEKRVNRVSEILNIKELLKRKPRQLSGGQRQRVALGRAIVREPKIFLFDEPLSNLDAKLRVQMRGELARLHRQLSATIIYVTHDQIEAMTLGQKIVVLKDGETQQIADPLTLYKKPKNKFVAGFIGSPPMNFINGIIKREDNKIKFIGEKIMLEIGRQFEKFVGRQAILGVRPADFSLAPGIEFPILVDVIEPVGDETYVYGKCGEVLIQVRVPEGIHCGVGECIKLSVPEEKVYIFDAKTEESLL